VLHDSKLEWLTVDKQAERQHVSAEVVRAKFIVNCSLERGSVQHGPIGYRTLSNSLGVYPTWAHWTSRASLFKNTIVLMTKICQ
jgi:hypothetical protein